MPVPQPRFPPHPINGARYSPASFNPLKRSRTPMNDDHHFNSGASHHAADKELGVGEERRRTTFKDLYARSERMLSKIFQSETEREDRAHEEKPVDQDEQPYTRVEDLKTPAPPKRTARTIDEDDYGGDDDDEEEEEVEPPDIVSPMNARLLGKPKMNGFLAVSTPTLPTPRSPLDRHSALPTVEHSKSSDEARKQLEEEKKAAEDAAKESSKTMFYTLENDRDAMLEQQKLDELDRQVEAEASGSGHGGGGANGAPQQGTLSSTNLGTSSLTLKHLIARIDARRDMVKASDQHLRILMSEVRKNRSKWASEDKIGQEDLYEAAERVLMELKAKTDWAAPFLQKVNKREAPDYYNVIKHPMDIGTMLKKLKNLQYQSKKEFVDDLDLIWSNCLKYNANPEHFLRKKAEHMKKETARLIPLIPDVIIKTRAEQEAEERRLQTEFDDGEESEEEPLRTVRGRKAPGKSSKKGATTARKAPPTDVETTPAPETRSQAPNAGSLSAIANLKNEHLRGDLESGLSTPPPRIGTPLGMNGAISNPAAGSQADMSEVETLDASVNGAALAQQEDLEHEDDDYKTWRQVTKKDRALVAAERHRLFKADRINSEEPALLRTKAGMRRWTRLQKSSAGTDQDPNDVAAKSANQADEAAAEATTLAEEIDGDDDCALPDYYDPLAGIPHLNDRLSWMEDTDGQVIDRNEECLRILPQGYFTSPQSNLTSKIEANMRQMQESRKLVAKIAIVKQMQLQTQTYQNQFQKYEPEPFHEMDIPPHVVSDEGPVMTPWVCRAAFQRSVGKIFYLAGFEDFQPSALETMTDVASQYFTNLVRHLAVYSETPMVYTTVPEVAPAALTTSQSAIIAGPAEVLPVRASSANRLLRPRFTQEEAILHMLRESGHDLENLEFYVKDDIDRLSNKLETHHARTRDHLAELLRPALDPGVAGADGAGVFNDGSEQFVGGDFAEDIGEDFFGFKELGLDKEFGIAGFSVPLHLLQSRMASVYQPTNAAAASTAGLVVEPPPQYPPLTAETLEEQIGLVKEFFKEKLDKAGDQPLIEDEDLPPKQRFPRPRLPPTGKISSPRKRPIREQQMMARKKRRQEIEAERGREAAAANALANGSAPPGPSGEASAPLPNGQDTVMVNGDSTSADRDAEGDHDTAVNDVPQPSRKVTVKPPSKIKLEPTPSDAGANGKGGDPKKHQQKQGGSGSDRGDDGGGANGILSPETPVIAAH